MLTFADDAKVTVGKTSVGLVQIQAGAPTVLVAAFLTNISALTLAPEIPVTLLHPLALG